MRATRNLLGCAVVSLGLGALGGSGAVPALAAGDESRGDLKLLERPTKALDRAIDRHEKRKRRREKRQERNRPEWPGAGGSSVAGVSRATLAGIAACESGGDPGAVSSDGTYRGKYQFDTGTWASVGGSGDPAEAPEAEQDYRAALLYSRSGSSPWPVCG